MLCYCPYVVVCEVVDVTYVSPVPLSPSSSPRPWSFRPRRICPTCPCRGCRRLSALQASRRTMTTTMTPQASLIFRRAEHPKHQLHHDVFVVLVVPTCLHLRRRRRRCRPPKGPSQSWRSPTSKKLHVSALSLPFVATLLPLLPS